MVAQKVFDDSITILNKENDALRTKVSVQDTKIKELKDQIN
jgi:hypothetical protein